MRGSDALLRVELFEPSRGLGWWALGTGVEHAFGNLWRGSDGGADPAQRPALSHRLRPKDDDRKSLENGRDEAIGAVAGWVCLGCGAPPPSIRGGSLGPGERPRPG